MPRLPHSPWFDLPNNIWWWLQIMKLSTVQRSALFSYFIPLGTKYFHSNFHYHYKINFHCSKLKRTSPFYTTFEIKDKVLQFLISTSAIR
jgi:hypothetical protein